MPVVTKRAILWTAKKFLSSAISVNVLVIVFLLLLHNVSESHSRSLSASNQTSRMLNASVGESHPLRNNSLYDDEDRIQHLIDSDINEAATNAIANELLLVTVLKRDKVEGDGQVTFLVDHALVYMTVSVKSDGHSGSCVLTDQFGLSPMATIWTRNTKRWTVHRPRVGPWYIQHGAGGQYNISVQGASSMEMEVSLYHTDVHTGVAQLVDDNPTAGQQVRTIIDILGAEVVARVYNTSLVTLEGQEVASNWLRPAGDPSDPQYTTTFTWPTEPVYIHVYGEENDGSFFERQTASLITPILIELRLVPASVADVIRPEKSLSVRYRLTNRGQSDTFVLTASVDNEVFSARVSPAQIRLGHMGSISGSVTVSVRPYSPATTGLLTISSWSLSRPTSIQSVTLFLASQTDVTDDDPPSCETISVTGNCTEEDVTSSTCDRRHWAGHLSVDDAISGLRDIRFAEVTSDDHYRISPFTEGQANEPVLVSFTATCCEDTIVLDASDIAGNSQSCIFTQAEIQPYRVPTSQPHQTSTTSRTHNPPATHPGNLQKHSSTAAHHTEASKPVWTKSPTVPTVSGSRSSPRTTTPAAVVTKPLSTSLNNSVAAQYTVTHLSKGDKKHKGISSTLKTASIILGSIGGVAGLSIASICILFYYRYRRLQRQPLEDDNSNNDDSSRNNDDSNHRRQRPRLPDLLRAQSPRRNFSTLL